MSANPAGALPEGLHELDGQVVGRFGSLWLGSHFQPIFSLAHGRVVGHEALLRAKGDDGQAVSPLSAFQRCHTVDEIALCDTLSRRAHLLNYARARVEDQWLFLNVNARAFLHGPTQHLAAQSAAWLKTAQIRPEQVVVELLEDAIEQLGVLEQVVADHKAHGFLIALDDFGAGHSNFDRVWRLQPDIVKLDRSIVVRAARELSTARMISQLTSLLHECGALVLMEGVETYEEAMVAMDSDVDLIQGYYFCRPQAALLPKGSAPEALTRLYAGQDQRRRAQHLAHKELVAPYINAIGHAGVLLGSGRSMAEACESFLTLPGGQLTYLLDANGRQIGESLWRSDGQLGPHAAYLPLRETSGASWAGRPYFRRAIESPGKVQVTRPYRTLQGRQLCFTVSSMFLRQQGGEQVPAVICGDVLLHDMPDGSVKAGQA